jgi:ubiquitin-conjugating enzyme E2 I
MATNGPSHRSTLAHPASRIYTHTRQHTHTHTHTPTQHTHRQPPKVVFTPVIFHPNIYPSGTVCLSILDPGKGWKSSITLKEILLGVQELLDTPNLDSPAQADPYHLLKRNPAAYEKRVRELARAFRPV